MVLCPIAIAVGCKKCPAYSVCPVKGIIGDDKPAEKAPPAAETKSSGTTKRDK